MNIPTAESPTPDAILRCNIAVPMRDSTELRADLWLPITGAQVPVVVVRTPYDKRTLNSDFLRPQQCLERGFAMLVQDTRGRFASAGEWTVIQWDQEGPDTYDTVEWASAQPWCDGRVFMAGASYHGLVQLLGACERPPHLAGIAPAMTTSWEFDRAETGGALRLDHIVSWFAFMAADWIEHQLRDGNPPDQDTLAALTELMHDPTQALTSLPLTKIDEQGLGALPLTFGQLLNGCARTLPPIDYADIRCPTLSITGWYDIFCSGTIGQFQELAAHNPHAGHTLIVGPWTHSNSLSSVQGEINFGIAASAAALKLHDLTLDFFARCTGPQDAAVPPVRYFLMGADIWQTAAGWPPPAAVVRHMFLNKPTLNDQGYGALTEDTSNSRSHDSYRYDPLDPVPTHGGRVFFLGRLAPGPLDQTHILSRPDVLGYRSALLTEPLDVVGPVRVRLHFSSTAADTDIVAKLCDIYPDGRAVPVAEGALRIGYRDNDEAPSPPDVARKITVELGHTAHRFRRGHRLLLIVTSSNFPHLDRNLNTGEPTGGTAPPIIAEQTIWYGAGRSSVVELTVLPNKIEE